MFFRLRKARNFSMRELLRSNCVTTPIIRDGAGLRNHFPAEKGDRTARRRPSCPAGVIFAFFGEEAFHGNIQNFRDGLKFQVGDDAGTMLYPGQRAPADRNRPGFRFDGQLFLRVACLFPGPANAFPGDVQKGR